MGDEEYLDFVNKNQNKSLLEIEPINIREKIIKAFATINSNVRFGERAYNEMFLSNPRVMGVFAYKMNEGNNIQNPVEFSESDKRIIFLKKFAKQRNIPLIIFGN